ncbi:selT/selW/selH-like putative selenoprotein [Rhodococcus sp. SMB37]|nr:selT/selW/selH-like putative selenoprotein [Rhodococcus sp. SMB37]
MVDRLEIESSSCPPCEDDHAGRYPPSPACVEAPPIPTTIGGASFIRDNLVSMTTTGPRVTIAYCTQCQWLLRAGWMAQELLNTFGTDLGEVALVPGTGGIFHVAVDGRTVWDRKADGGFPDIVTLKQRVRDIVDPARDLGHADRK